MNCMNFFFQKIMQTWKNVVYLHKENEMGVYVHFV